jgi:hypothetical protein
MLLEVIIMKRVKSISDGRIEEYYIFYVSLAVVITIAVIGIAMDVVGR